MHAESVSFSVPVNADYLGQRALKYWEGNLSINTNQGQTFPEIHNEMNNQAERNKNALETPIRRDLQVPRNIRR